MRIQKCCHMPWFAIVLSRLDLNSFCVHARFAAFSSSNASQGGTEKRIPSWFGPQAQVPRQQRRMARGQRRCQQ